MESEQKAGAASNKVTTLLDLLSPFKRILILPHDHPDPDALASALALRALIRHNLKQDPRIGLSGVIGRSENRAFVSVLEIPLTPVEEIFPGFKGAVVLVDTQPGRSNNSLPIDRNPTAVIDHHPDWGNNGPVPFVDLREGYGATSTILTEYLQEGEVPLEPKVATAMFYGIASETQGLKRETQSKDIFASQFLYPYMNKRLLGEIEHPPLTRSYFKLVGEAVRRAQVYGDAVVTTLPNLPYPDAVAEIADFFLRMEKTKWSVCIGPYKAHLHVSIRAKDPDAGAGRLLDSILPEGMGGGHDMIAGGKLKLPRGRKKETVALLTGQIVDAIGKKAARPQPLVSFKDD